MARKNTLPYHVVVDQSMTSTFTSPVTTIVYTDNVSYQINCITTNSIGTIAIEVSNDYSFNTLTGVITNPGIWNPLDLGGTPSVNANDTVIDISLNQLPYGAIRFTYTASTPGTGICNAYFLSKQIGG